MKNAVYSLSSCSYFLLYQFSYELIDVTDRINDVFPLMNCCSHFSSQEAKSRHETDREEERTTKITGHLKYEENSQTLKRYFIRLMEKISIFVK